MSGRSLVDALLRCSRGRRPPASLPALERRARPTSQEFARLRRAGRPALLDGVLDDWPCRTELTLSRLRERFGDRRLPALATNGGRLAADVATGVAFDTVRLGDYVERVAAGEPVDGYLGTPLDTWFPELKEDMPFPVYCRDAPWRNARLWLGPAGTAVPLHRDVAQNVFVQLVGRKRFLLYPPAASPWLYSHAFRSALPNYSRFDPERPDYERFPLSRAVRAFEVVLGPGDAMYLPSRWWHQVRSLDVSLSVAFWWADGALALAVRTAEFVKRVRGLEIYGLERRLGGRGDPRGAARPKAVPPMHDRAPAAPERLRGAGRPEEAAPATAAIET